MQQLIDATEIFISWLETGLSTNVVDGDFVSLYPTLMTTFNTSRMTLTFVPYSITGKDQPMVRKYFADLITVRENAVSLCSQYIGLPSYQEMNKLISAKLGA